jgi:hypothetical protein
MLDKVKALESRTAVLPKDALPQQTKHPAFLSGVLVDALFAGFRLS